MRIEMPKPDPRLAAYVAEGFLNRYTPDDTRYNFYRQLPTGTGRIIYHVAPGTGPNQGRRVHLLFAAGPCHHLLNVPFAIMETVIVNLKPGALGPVLGLPADRIKNAVMPLENIWGKKIAEDLLEAIVQAPNVHARWRLLEGSLISRLDKMNAPDPLVVRCVEKIHRGRGLTKVEDLAKQLKCAPRQLLRSFESGLGASPKQYSQIVRVRLLLEEFLPEMSPRLSDLAQDHGYHDQAHAIHDFKELMGMTPGEFQQEKVNPNVSFHNEVDALVRKLGKSGIPSPPLIERWLMRRVFKSAFIS